MEINFYEQQMARLKQQWPNAYSQERMKVIYSEFKDIPNFDFRDAVTYCLGNCKGSPLLPEIREAVEKVRAAYFAQKRIEEANLNNGIFGIKNNGVADPEYVKKCVELFQTRYKNKEISYEQYQQGCDLLDQAAKLYKKNNIVLVKPKEIAKPYKDDEERPY